MHPNPKPLRFDQKHTARKGCEPEQEERGCMPTALKENDSFCSLTSPKSLKPSVIASSPW